MSNSSQFNADKLQQGIQALNLDLTEGQVQQLLHYLSALALWNKKFNLTAITDPNEMLIKHLLDSMSILPFLPSVAEKPTLLDVGTGAGLPGVIIAICEPDRQCTVLDSNSKKIRFIRQVAGELSLKNIFPVHERIENLAEHGKKFDVITSRAFASLIDFTTVVESVLAENGTVQAMKGVVPDAEISTLATDWHIESSRLHVPFLADERHLIALTKII